MSQARLARYLPGSNGDKHLALRLYIWNARLCEEFYVPIQFTEITLRNAIHRRLSELYRENWYDDHRFIDILPDRHKEEVRSTAASEKSKRRRAFTADHVVAGLSFGFWQSLLGSKYAFVIWKDDSIRNALPHLPNTLGRPFVYDRVEQLRKFRNSVMHHCAIYDKGPTREFANIRDLLTWLCPDTLWLMQKLANPAAILQRRPRF